MLMLVGMIGANEMIMMMIMTTTMTSRFLTAHMIDECCMVVLAPRLEGIASKNYAPASRFMSSHRSIHDARSCTRYM